MLLWHFWAPGAVDARVSGQAEQDQKRATTEQTERDGGATHTSEHAQQTASPAAGSKALGILVVGAPAVVRLGGALLLRGQGQLKGAAGLLRRGLVHALLRRGQCERGSCRRRLLLVPGV